MTYSIVARDPTTGELGVAVQSHWFAAGSLVPWAEAGVGAVATQASVEVSYGPRGLDLMRAGASAPKALERLLADDDDRDVRQVAMVDAGGMAATHTGGSAIPAAGHASGEGFSAQANMMWDDTVWSAMAARYTSAGGDLTHRLLDALDAAEAERGDLRGRQAAGILIVGAERLDEPFRGVAMHLHVDDHPDPLAELRRLVNVHAAYEQLQIAEDADLALDRSAASRARQAALATAPDMPEVAYWAAIGLASGDSLDEAVKLIRPVYAQHAGWRELLHRLVDHGLVDLPPDAATRLLDA